MKQRDALEIFTFKNYYGAQATTVLLNASNSVKYAVKTASIVKQHKRVETLLERSNGSALRRSALLLGTSCSKQQSCTRPHQAHVLT